MPTLPTGGIPPPSPVPRAVRPFNFGEGTGGTTSGIPGPQGPQGPAGAPGAPGPTTLAALSALFTADQQIFSGTGNATGEIIDLLAALKEYFGAANQVILGTGAGTGALTDIGTAINNKFTAAGQVRVGTGSATGEVLGAPTWNGTVLQQGGADPSTLEWASVQVVTTIFTANAYTFVAADANTAQQASNGASAGTITVPANATTAFPVGTVITVTQTGSGKVQIAAAGGVTINSSVSGGFVSGTTGCRAQYSSIGLLKTGANTWVMSGDMG